MSQLKSHGCAAIGRGMTLLATALRALWQERRGATAVFVAVAIIPLVAFVGLAVDTTRGYLVKSRLNQALDAAALAGGRVFSEATRDDDIRMYFAANFPAGYLGATTTPVQIAADNSAKTITVSAEATLPTTFMHLLDFNNYKVASSSQVKIEAQNLELSVVLDITGSMGTSGAIADLIVAANDLVDIVVNDVQTPFYSRVAIVPFSQAVNVGPKAAEIRGPITAGQTITSITKANPAVLTVANHGFVTGDKVYISGVAGGGFTALNSSVSASGPNATPPSFWIVQKIDNNTFNLKKCSSASNCTSFSSLISSSGYSGSYTANTGTIYCTSPGCNYQSFINASGSWRSLPISSCVTERVGANAYTDVAPSTAFVGRNYPDSGNNCVSRQIVPLTADKPTLHAAINALTAAGSTAGQIGTAWGWYMLSPNFSYLWTADVWPTAHAPAAYGTDKLLKVAIIMTDGDFNTIYNSGIIAQDAGSGSGSASVHIGQNASNGNGFTQAKAICQAMKATGTPASPGPNIEIYTIGLGLSGSATAMDFLEKCATSKAHMYTPNTGAEMQDAFRDIAQKLSKLRLTK